LLNGLAGPEKDRLEIRLERRPRHLELLIFNAAQAHVLVSFRYFTLSKTVSACSSRLSFISDFEMIRRLSLLSLIFIGFAPPGHVIGMHMHFLSLSPCKAYRTPVAGYAVANTRTWRVITTVAVAAMGAIEH